MRRRGSYIALREKLGIPRGVSRDEMRLFWSHRYYHGEGYDWARHCARQSELDALRRVRSQMRVDKIEDLVRSRRRVAV